MRDNNFKELLILLCLFSVALIIRTPDLSNVSPYPDENQYHWKTNTILVNNWALVGAVFDYNPPFIQYIEAGVTLLFGGDLNTLRLVSVVFGSLTIPFIYLFGKTIYNRKTGLLAAIFLLLSSYHILYSRNIMLEIPTIFFITAFLYFFWLSQCRENAAKSLTYAAVAGAMMGLAFDAKYMAGFLVPAVPIYILWTNKFNFRTLIDKKTIILYIFAFLFVLPLLFSLFYTGVGFHGLSYYIQGRFEKQTPNSNRAASLPISDLIIKMLEKMEEVLSWGAQILTSPWKDIFSTSAILLFLITLLYYMYGFIYFEKKESFFIISLMMLSIILVLSASYKHYLLYILPFYYVMLSNLAATSFEQFRKEKGFMNVLRIFILSLTAIMLLSYVIVGATSSYWDEGEYSWAKSSIKYILNDINKDGTEGEILIGNIALSGTLENEIYLNNLDAQSFKINKIGNKYSSKIAEVDLNSIDTLKPDYLIIDKDKYSFYFTPQVKEEVFNNYSIVFHSPTYPYGSIVFKKKNKEKSHFFDITVDKNGEISGDMFNNSVPIAMKIGKVYTMLVEVKNTGNTTMKFMVHAYSDNYTIFVDNEFRNTTLNKGSLSLFKFKLLPYRENSEKVPVTVDLYAKYDETSAFKRVDSSTDYVYFIGKPVVS